VKGLLLQLLARSGLVPVCTMPSGNLQTATFERAQQLLAFTFAAFAFADAAATAAFAGALVISVCQSFRFISDHGGHTNAYTAAEDTNYQFDVNWDALPEALDRWAWLLCRRPSCDTDDHVMCPTCPDADV